MKRVDLRDPADPRLAPFRDLRDRQHRREAGTFVAESEVVVRKLLASRFTVRAVLVTPARLRALANILGDTYPTYVAEPSVLDGIAGFPVHRGCLALAERPAEASIPPEAATVLVLEELVDVDNVGSMIRNAAALGVDAVLLSPGCADPYYRKAARTSAGHVFTVPLRRCARWPEDLRALGRERTVVGAVLDPEAVPLWRFVWPNRVALVLGTEGAGLSAAAKGCCERLVSIPMAPAADSLNVASAGAVLLYARAAALGESRSTMTEP